MYSQKYQNTAPGFPGYKIIYKKYKSVISVASFKIIASQI